MGSHDPSHALFEKKYLAGHVWTSLGTRVSVTSTVLEL